LNTNTVSVMTGFCSTYRDRRDLGSVLDNGEPRVAGSRRGSAQAVADILLLRGVDAGIVRRDTRLS
jgi:hypothetical protein